MSEPTRAGSGTQPPPLTEAEVFAMMARAEAAQRGPWRVIADREGMCHAIFAACGWPVATSISDTTVDVVNLTAIAAAREDVPSLARSWLALRARAAAAEAKAELLSARCEALEGEVARVAKSLRTSELEYACEAAGTVGAKWQTCFLHQSKVAAHWAGELERILGAGDAPAGPQGEANP